MEAPRTVERNRHGKVTDRIMIPTPPRTGQAVHWPTPDSVRQPSKRAAEKIEPVLQTQIIPPTPETLPRPKRKSDAGFEETRLPSPSGHTTFFQSTSSSGSRNEKISKRRPGLTFAQQMGLLTNAPSTHAGRPGVGVGMGGSRHGGPKKDQIIPGRLAEPMALTEPSDDNPFITKAGRQATYSPGRSTLHEPRADVADEDALTSPMLIPGSTSSSCLINSNGLHTPPPTRHKKSARIAAQIDEQALEAEARNRQKAEIRQRKEAEERKRKQKEMMQMMDVASNPFLAKPGESSRSRQRNPLPVDETRPTVTYVFRGSRKVFANPFYPADAAYPPAELDPEDEDYEVHPNPKPRLLFPSPPPVGKRFKSTDFDSPPSTTREATPPSSPMMATPRRRLFTKEIALAVGPSAGLSADEDEEADEDEDELLSDTPVARRLFQPVNDLKRAADGSVETRADKRARGVRM